MDAKKLGIVSENSVSVSPVKKEEPRLGVVIPAPSNVVSVAPVLQGPQAVAPGIPKEVVISAPPPPPPPPAPPLGVAWPSPKISRVGGDGKIKLSVLITTLASRAGQLGPLLGKLVGQMKALPEQDVEIVVFEDQKQFNVGQKRNRLVDEARGDFVAFVDDDDDVSDDYLWQLRQAIAENPGIDCVGFRGLMSVAGQGTRQVHYSLENPAQVESGGTYYRTPGHLNAIRKDCLSGVRFPEQNFGEDADFSLQLARKKALRKEAFVDKVLYHYLFNPNTSETHPNRPAAPIMGLDRSIFHVVILSNVADNLRGCLDSILRNEPTLPRDRIVVVDDGAREDCEKEYPGITWLRGEKPFVFARNANIAIRHCPNDVILLNDDARLETKYGFSSMGFATKAREEVGITSAAIRGFVGNKNQEPWGLEAGMRKEPRNVAFVCVYIPRDTIERIGVLDERFTGYGFEDNDYCHRVKINDLFIMIYDGCVVEHNSTENKSTYRVKPNVTYLMEESRKIFSAKWPNLKMGPVK